MPRQTHETASNEFVQIGDVQVVYRRFGKPGAPPLVLLNYFAANMDDWDPKITNGFAKRRDVIIFDYPGVGRSTGSNPSTVAKMTKDASLSAARLNSAASTSSDFHWAA